MVISNVSDTANNTRLIVTTNSCKIYTINCYSGESITSLNRFVKGGVTLSEPKHYFVISCSEEPNKTALLALTLSFNFSNLFFNYKKIYNYFSHCIPSQERGVGVTQLLEHMPIERYTVGLIPGLGSCFCFCFCFCLCFCFCFC